MIRVSKPGTNNRIFSSPISPHLLFDQHRGSSSHVARSKVSADHSKTSSAEIKNEWSSTFTPTIRLCGLDRDNYFSHPPFRELQINKYNSSSRTTPDVPAGVWHSKTSRQHTTYVFKPVFQPTSHTPAAWNPEHQLLRLLVNIKFTLEQTRLRREVEV